MSSFDAVGSGGGEVAVARETHLHGDVGEADVAVEDGVERTGQAAAHHEVVDRDSHLGTEQMREVTGGDAGVRSQVPQSPLALGLDANGLDGMHHAVRASTALGRAAAQRRRRISPGCAKRGFEQFDPARFCLQRIDLTARQVVPQLAACQHQCRRQRGMICKASLIEATACHRFRHHARQ